MFPIFTPLGVYHIDTNRDAKLIHACHKLLCTFPIIIVIVFCGYVPEKVVLSYSVILWILIPRKLVFYFRYTFLTNGLQFVKIVNPTLNF